LKVHGLHASEGHVLLTGWAPRGYPGGKLQAKFPFRRFQKNQKQVHGSCDVTVRPARIARPSTAMKNVHDPIHFRSGPYCLLRQSQSPWTLLPLRYRSVLKSEPRHDLVGALCPSKTTACMCPGSSSRTEAAKVAAARFRLPPPADIDKA
jgi:hypothetical protein